MQTITKLSYDEVIKYVGNICNDLDDDDVHVDMVVCLCPSSTSLGQLMSNYLDAPLQCVSWEVGGDNNETNCWLPENASEGESILIITESNDNALLSSLIEDWKSSMAGDVSWLDNVIFASLVSNTKSEFLVDYSGIEVGDDSEFSMPWSDWWQ